MNSAGQKKNPLLTDVLNCFFNKKEIDEFLDKYFDSALVPAIQTSKKSEKKSEPDIRKESDLRIETDLLLTFAETKLTRDKFLELLLSLGQLAMTSGEFSLAIDIYEKLLNETRDKKEYINIYANAFLSLGEMNSRQARWQLSFNNIKKSGDIFDKQKDNYSKAKCENLLGTIYGEIGDLKKAKKFFEKSLLSVENDKDNTLKGAIEINLGIISNIQGNYDLALSYYHRALLNFQKVKNLKRIAEIKHNIGMTYLKLNKFESSLYSFDESIEAAEKAGALTTLGITYVSKAYLFTVQKDFSLAEAFTDKAMDICHKTNDRLSIADIYKIKGIIQRNKLNYKVSENLLLTSLRINKEFGNNLNFAETNYELGLLYKATGKFKESRERFSNALKYFKSINALPEIKIIQEEANSIS